MAKVDPFHTDTVLANYHPRERYVYHYQSGCDYGQRIIKDGNRKPGIGTDPLGHARQKCDRCLALGA
jgi:hypothetical protein